MNEDKRLGDVVKLWLTTPTYNVFALESYPISLTVMPRQGKAGKWRHWYANYGKSLFDLVGAQIAEYTNGERFESGVIEFDTGEQIELDVMWSVRHVPVRGEPSSVRHVAWHVIGTKYRSTWTDAAEVDDATLVHRAIVAYQTYRGEAKERGENG